MFGGEKNIKLSNKNNLTLDEKYLHKVMKFILESEYSNDEINELINDKILSYEELIMNIATKYVYYFDNIRHILAYYKSNSLEESNYINDIIIYSYEWSHDNYNYDSNEISSLSGELTSLSDNDKPLFKMDDITNSLDELVKEGFCVKEDILDDSIFSYNMPSIDDIENAECVSD